MRADYFAKFVLHREDDHQIEKESHDAVGRNNFGPCDGPVGIEQASVQAHGRGRGRETELHQHHDAHW